MVLEIALIDVTPGSELDFAASYRSVRSVLSETPGCQSVRLTKGIESESQFVLMVEWDSVEAHEKNFRGTERFIAWRAAIGQHFSREPRVEHFEEVPDHL